MPDCFQNENEKKKTELPEALIGSSPLPPAKGEEGRKGGGGGSTKYLCIIAQSDRIR